MKNLLLYVFLALLALLAGLGALVLAGVCPFGEATLCWQDNGQQVASDFGYVRGVWENRHTLDWSYACGGSPRSSFHPTFNNLCSPLTWAVAALSGCSFYGCFINLSAVTELSLLFLLQLAFLPLGVFFYLRKTFPRLTVGLGMTLALAYAFGAFVLTHYTFLPFLNVAILFPWYVAALDALLKRGRWMPYCLLLAWMLAVGTYFAWMWLLFAAVYAAARTGWRWNSPVRQHSLALVLASAGALLLSACSWLPSFLVTAQSARAEEAHFWWNATRAELEWAFPACLFGLPFFLLARLERRPLRSRYACAALVLAVGLMFISSTTLWHLSRPWDFPGRFGYMLEFMLLCLAAQAAQRRRLCWRVALPLVAVLSSLFLTMVLWNDNRIHGGCYQASADRVQSAEWAAKQVLEPEGRAKSRGHAAVENLAFFTPFDSLSHFTACITAEQESTLARWGYQQRAAVISSEGGTQASDTLLGMRYVLSQYEDGDYAVTENPYYFGMGLMVPEGVFPLQGTDPIARQQELLGALLGAEHAGVRCEGRVGVPFQGSLKEYAYLWHEGRFGYEGHPYARWHGVESPPALWELPLDCTVREWKRGQGKGEYTLFLLPQESLEALKHYGQEQPVRSWYTGYRMWIDCHSTTERPVLFLPLLWQERYRVTVDREHADLLNLDGFVGVALPTPGKHRVTLTYVPEDGGLLTLLSLPLLLGAWLLTRRSSPLASRGGLNEFCRRAMLGGSLLLLFWPLLVLPIGLCWR